MTTFTAYAHHTPGAHASTLITEGGPVFRTAAAAREDVPAGKAVVLVHITSYGWRRFTVQGVEHDGPFSSLDEAVATADAAGLPLDAVRVFTAVNDGDKVRYSESPLSTCITAFAGVDTPSLDDAVLQPAIRELLGHQQLPGGVEPGKVTGQLLNLWLIADPDTEAKLASVFPEMAWAIDKLQNSGLVELQKTIGYGE